MKLDKSGIELITKWEGLKLTPYLCSAGIPTIGYGSTYYENGRKVMLTDAKITKERAVELFENTVKTFEAGVLKLLGTTKVNQNQFNALVSFAYNLGLNALKNSTLLKLVKLNAIHFKIETEFGKWVNAGGKKVQGLVNRRNDEVKMYYKKVT